MEPIVDVGWVVRDGEVAHQQIIVELPIGWQYEIETQEEGILYINLWLDEDVEDL